MKKIIALFLTMCMLLSMAVVASAETWVCQACGTENEHKFCGECGAPKSTEWTCANCGTKNESKFCGECGTARGASGGTAPTDPPAPAVTEAPAEQSKLVVKPRVDFYYLDNYKTVYTSEADELYAGDYSEDTRVYVAVNVINEGSEDVEFTLTATVNGHDYAFNPYTIAAGDDHGFFISAHDLRQAGTYDVTWYVDGVEAASDHVTVRNGKSDFYRWLQLNMKIDVSMCVWDTNTSKRVRNNILVGNLSELDDGQVYSPHLIVENLSTSDTPSMYISFFAGNIVRFWENQVIEAESIVNYLNSSFSQEVGDTPLVMFINGIEVGRGTMHIAK